MVVKKQLVEKGWRYAVLIFDIFDMKNVVSKGYCQSDQKENNILRFKKYLQFVARFKKSSLKVFVK
jgi:hypothetical protein